MTAFPELRLQAGRHKRVKAGHPWVFSNELADARGMKDQAPGSLVTVVADSGEILGTAFFNPRPLISARLLSRHAGLEADVAFFRDRLGRALALRDRLVDVPHYRLAHAEADGLPGLVIDRFGAAVVIQLNAAGMDARRDQIVAALDALLAPETIVFRNDSPARVLEGLDCTVETVRGENAVKIDVIENDCRFVTSPGGGQKTGWFFDQRDNRAFVAGLARGGTMLDVYTYAGGFAVQAAVRGATEVFGIDRSADALALAREAADRNGVGARCRFERDDAFAAMKRLADEGRRFDTVVVDPPSFVKSKKDLHAGLRGYRKMVKLAAPLVAPGGVLFAASCSHNAPADAFGEQVRRGLGDARRTGRILRAAGAAPDHPVHPSLPESAYLKSLTLVLD